MRPLPIRCTSEEQRFSSESGKQQVYVRLASILCQSQMRSQPPQLVRTWGRLQHGADVVTGNSPPKPQTISGGPVNSSTSVSHPLQLPKTYFPICSWVDTSMRGSAFWPYGRLYFRGGFPLAQYTTWVGRADGDRSRASPSEAGSIHSCCCTAGFGHWAESGQASSDVPQKKKYRQRGIIITAAGKVGYLEIWVNETTRARHSSRQRH